MLLIRRAGLLSEDEGSEKLEPSREWEGGLLAMGQMFTFFFFVSLSFS